MTKPNPEPDAAASIRALRERIYDAAQDLFHDAASWRDAADMTGGHAAGALTRDALANEKLAAQLREWVDELEALLASPPPVSRSRLQQEQEPLRASELSDGVERQDLREVPNEKAPCASREER